jgi:hypothetical protein
VPLTVLVSVRVTTPLTVVPVPVTVPIVVVTVTVVPLATRLLLASYTVTVSVELSIPSATSVVFDAAITALAGTPAMNRILVSPVTVASAVPVGASTPNVAVPVVVLLRYRVTTPLTVFPLPFTRPSDVVSVTVVPSATRFPWASLTVIVKAVWSTPSATTVVLEAAMAA